MQQVIIMATTLCQEKNPNGLTDKSKVKVVDSCWFFSIKWSDTLKNMYIITAQKSSQRFDRKNTVFEISRKLIETLVLK